MTAPPVRVLRTLQAGEGHRVITLAGGGFGYRKAPCKTCPWRVDATGVFPPEAFALAAGVARDMAERTFGCHESGAEKPATCAGFLLRGGDHNLSVRLGRMRGRIKDDVTDGGHALHKDYRSMAVANGLPPGAKALKFCRDAD